MEKFEKNCSRFNDYQKSVMEISAVWNAWLIGNSATNTPEKSDENLNNGK